MPTIKQDDVSDPLFLYTVEQYKKSNNDLTVDIVIVQSEYQRFWFIMKMLAVYRNGGDLNTRLLLNHLIILTNIFELSAVSILLRIAIDKADYDILSYVMTILHFIGYVPDNKEFNIMGEEYILTDIPINTVLLQKLERDIL